MHTSHDFHGERAYFSYLAENGKGAYFARSFRVRLNFTSAICPLFLAGVIATRYKCIGDGSGKLRFFSVSD